MSYALTAIFSILAGGLGALLLARRGRPTAEPSDGGCPTCGYWSGTYCAIHRDQRPKAAAE